MGYLKPYKAGFTLAMLGMAGYACVDIYFISQFSDFIDRGIMQKDTAYLAWAPVFVVAMFFYADYSTLCPPTA